MPDLSDKALAERFHTTPGAVVCFAVILCAAVTVGMGTLVLCYYCA